VLQGSFKDVAIHKIAEVILGKKRVLLRRAVLDGV
jgi:hypothetical protein